MNLNAENYLTLGLKILLAFFAYGFTLITLNIGRLIAVETGFNNNIIQMFNISWRVAIMLTIALISVLFMFMLWKLIKGYIEAAKMVR